MKQHLAAVALLVRDYDEALAFIHVRLGLSHRRGHTARRRQTLARDRAARHGRDALAARPRENERELRAVGDQAGGRVFLFLQTDDFARDHAAMCARGVKFHEAPRHETYGTVAVFEDLYGNKWDLLQLNSIGESEVERALRAR